MIQLQHQIYAMQTRILPLRIMQVQPRTVTMQKHLAKAPVLLRTKLRAASRKHTEKSRCFLRCRLISYFSHVYKSVVYTLSRCMSMLGEMTVIGSSPQPVCLCQHLWLPFLLQRCHCQSATALASPRLHPLHPLSSQKTSHLQNDCPALVTPA